MPTPWKKMLRLTSAFALAAVSLTGCSSDSHTYVLVHGAFSDSNAWTRITPLLEEEGHKVVTLDLPAHGKDTTPADQASLQGYTDRVLQAVDAQEEPVILVGHSMGGTVISQVAEQRPEKVAQLVYVAAYLLPNGKSLLEAGQQDTESRLGQYLVFSADGKTATLKPEALKNAFCQDCSDADVATLSGSAPKPEPTAPLGTPVMVTAANWGRVPRVYIETKQDLAVGPALQKSLYTESPVERVLSVDSGHLPFFTKPNELAAHLLSL